MDQRPKVLVIEDIEALHYSYKRRLADKFELLGAMDHATAQHLFDTTPDLAAIAMDACLSGHEPDTLELVKDFRATFHGPMIAISSEPEFRQLLLDAGCSHECDKADFPKLILKIFGH